MQTLILLAVTIFFSIYLVKLIIKYNLHKNAFFKKKVLAHINNNPCILGKDLREMYNQNLQSWSKIMRVSATSFYLRIAELEDFDYVQSRRVPSMTHGEITYLREYIITPMGKEAQKTIVVPPLN